MDPVPSEVGLGYDDWGVGTFSGGVWTTSDMSTSSITHRTNEVFLSDLQQSD